MSTAVTRSSRSPVARLFDQVSRVYDADLLQKLVYRPAQDIALGRLRATGVKRVLDVGCGTGIFTSRMREELGLEVICGCDLSEGMLGQARERSSEVGWTRGDATKLPVRDRSVDAVVCTEAFHFFDQPAALEEFHRVLRPDGMLLVAMINPRTRIGSELLHRQAVLLGTGNWPTRSRMRSMVERAGFDVTTQHRVRRIASAALPTALTEAVRAD